MEKETPTNRRSFLKAAAAGTAGGLALTSVDSSAAMRFTAISETGEATAAPDDGGIANRIRGPLIPIQPVFAEDESLDVTSTCEWIDWLVQEGVPLFWTTQGTTCYFYLSDSEILELNRSVARVTKGRSILIAGIPFRSSTRESIRFAESAAEWGADIVLVQTNWQEKPDPEAAFRHYKALADHSPLPLFAYILGKWPENFIERVLDFPQYVGMKNDGGDYEAHSTFINAARRRGRAFVPMTGGEVRPYLYGRLFGAQAFADLVTCGIAPKVILDFARYADTGDYPKAVEIVRKYEEPLVEAFSPLGLHPAFRVARWLKGKATSYHSRFPMQTLDAKGVSTVESVLKKVGLL